MIRINLLHNVASARRARGLTQEQLARRTWPGAGHARVGVVEAGADVRVSTAVELSQALEVPVGDLVTMDPDEFRLRHCGGGG